MIQVIVRYERTMRNARPKVVEPEVCKPVLPAKPQEPAVVVAPKVEAFGPKTPAREIISRIGVVHGYSLAEIIGPGLEKPLVQARYDAIKAVADHRPELSTTQLGRIFNRDHASIIHALKKRGGRQRVSA